MDCLGSNDKAISTEVQDVFSLITFLSVNQRLFILKLPCDSAMIYKASVDSKVSFKCVWYGCRAQGRGPHVETMFPQNDCFSCCTLDLFHLHHKGRGMSVCLTIATAFPLKDYIPFINGDVGLFGMSQSSFRRPYVTPPTAAVGLARQMHA
jgi:hypothetical protein